MDGNPAIRPVLKQPLAPGVQVERRAQTRAEALLAEVRKQVLLREALLNAADDLGEITITVRLQAGTNWIRSVTWLEERLCRQRR